MIKTKPASITWSSIKDKLESNCMANYERYLIEHHGFESTTLIGMIGNGNKTHKFLVCAKLIPAHVTEWGMIQQKYYEVASCLSYCGSKKWQSSLYIIDDVSEPTCKRCV